MEKPIEDQQVIASTNLPAKFSPRERFLLWLSVVGTAGTIIGLVLSVYFYEASKVKPRLTLSVHPLKSELRRLDSDQELGFSYAGKTVNSESITSVEVCIWNAGTRSIHDSDILEPIRLVMPGKAAILNARITRTSRPLCNFKLDGSDGFSTGMCPLRWRILEPGDGAIVQIIYAGSAGLDPQLEGAVEGQRDGISVERFTLSPDHKTVEYPFLSTTTFIYLGTFFLLGVLPTVFGRMIERNSDAVKRLIKARREYHKRFGQKIMRTRTRQVWILLWFGYVAGIVTLLAELAMLYFQRAPGPPFGW